MHDQALSLIDRFILFYLQLGERNKSTCPLTDWSPVLGITLADAPVVLRAFPLVVFGIGRAGAYPECAEGGCR